MKLLSIEPTPSPNSMKLNLDESLPNGIQKEYSKQNKEQAAPYIQKLLDIPGVKSVFRAADFIALDRLPQAGWKEILAAVKEVFNTDHVEGEGLLTGQDGVQDASTFGEAIVYLQMFRTIPMQVKVEAGGEQIRAALPERFANIAMEAGKVSPNLIKERSWVEQGVRYGDLKEIGEEVAQEVDAAYDDERLRALMDEILREAGAAAADKHETVEQDEPIVQEPVITLEVLDDPDWRKRYAAMDRLEPQEEHLPILAKALRDPKSSVRRLAVVYLGMIGTEAVMPLLLEALKDSSVSVRRTAGDTLSDLGDPQAIPSMVEALQDTSKLVRWRAARFLFEQGDETALAGLHAAEEDPEFEVSLQVKMAIERIERGEAASGSVWQQMTNRERE
ncbi:virulence factor [Brevibacillus fluminis]|uniref:Virulence factor n=1 Tax=Brevibacillus fluminis TaxID=511487 RepID=A0A3M8D552_9BACL|nr:conserved virulence factor C family protein [Brevibacillus fluminis]RNB82345.1 virulence factor [Brevibacillus fluminis]